MVTGKRLDAIDGFRGWGALFLLFYHIYLEAENVPHLQFFHRFISFTGPWLVLVFFSVSGFLVYRTHQSRTHTEQRPTLNFYVRRFFRIVPLWWSILLVEFVTGGITRDVLLTSMFFIFGFLEFNAYYLPITPAWSLFVEEAFYLSFPYLFKRIKEWNVVLFLLIAYFIARAWTTLPLGVPHENFFIPRFPLANFQFFLIGILLYQAHKATTITALSARIFGPRAAFWLDGLTIIGVGGTAAGLWMPSEILAFSLIMALLNPDTLLSRLSRWPFFRWVGRRCFGVYLLSAVVDKHTAALSDMILLKTGLQHASAEIQVLVLFPVVCGITLFVATLTYSCLEKPCMKFGEYCIRHLEERGGIDLVSSVAFSREF